MRASALTAVLGVTCGTGRTPRSSSPTQSVEVSFGNSGAREHSLPVPLLATVRCGSIAPARLAMLPHRVPLSHEEARTRSYSPLWGQSHRLAMTMDGAYKGVIQAHATAPSQRAVLSSKCRQLSHISPLLRFEN